MAGTKHPPSRKFAVATEMVQDGQSRVSDDLGVVQDDRVKEEPFATAVPQGTVPARDQAAATA